MRDVQKPYQIAVYNKLNGAISVTVYDEKKKVAATDTIYAILSTQQSTPEDTSDSFISKEAIDIEVIEKTGSEVSKINIHTVSNEIINTLCPTPFSDLLSVNLQISHVHVESIITRVFEVSSTETIVRKIIKIVSTITQQT